jgi:hypothetical protein
MAGLEADYVALGWEKTTSRTLSAPGRKRPFAWAQRGTMAGTGRHRR